MTEREINVSNLSVLLVDDNEINQKYIELSLKPLGLNIEIAGNGEAAVSKFSANHYDVVLMDIQMPGIDGIETTKIIRDIEQKEMPDSKALIIGMSADSDDRLNENCREAGIDEQINKPFQPHELHEIINNYLSRNTLQ